jgi:mannonate dehydratase
MHRRQFLAGTLASASAAGQSRYLVELQGSAKKAQLKAGHQNHSADADLRVLAALGVNHICSALPSRSFDHNWSVQGLSRLRERVESFGIKLDMVPLPLSSSYISQAENPHIMMGKSPERDREIDSICQIIRNVARAGIPAVKYNLTILGVIRTGATPGRGGARYSTFVYDKSKQDGPPTETGPVSADEMWERITYFLKRVVGGGRVQGSAVLPSP